MTSKLSNQAECSFSLRDDCLASCAEQTDIMAGLQKKRIAITGGTGFLGSWVAEMVATLNDVYQLNINLDIYARSILSWSTKYPHLSGRDDIKLKSQDVRSPFEFDQETNFVIHAAGIPDNRIHVSDPLRVQQTIVIGASNALDAANQLKKLERFILVSSGLANGIPNRPGAVAENDCFPILAGQLHNGYIDSKRESENLAAIYRSQFRLPISVMRPFTFVGPYQQLDRPWAINSFLNDAIIGREIRVQGDGSARRSYLYGSDAAWWVLAGLVKGENGAVYNIGGPCPVTHNELISLIREKSSSKLRLSFQNSTIPVRQQDDLFPDTNLVSRHLGVTQTCLLKHAIDRTWDWNIKQLDIQN